MVDFISNNLKSGPAADPNTGVGPVQNSMQYAKVLNLFEAADKEGWKIATGGLKEKKEGKGFILPPTITFTSAFTRCHHSPRSSGIAIPPFLFAPPLS